MRIAPRKPNRATIPKLDTALTPEQRDELDRWMREGFTYAEIAERLVRNFGVKVSSSSLSAYYARRIAVIQPAELHNVRVGNESLEFEIVVRVQVRRTDLKR